MKNLASPVTRYHGQLSSRIASEKTDDPVLRKLADRQTDRQTDRQKDQDGQTDRQKNQGDFIGRCQTNVKHSTEKSNVKNLRIGRYSRWRRNEISEEIGFCNMHSLFITNSVFQHPAQHMSTWQTKITTTMK